MNWKRTAFVTVLLGSAIWLPVFSNACSWWDGENQLGRPPEGGPSFVCTNPIDASIASAFAAPAGSSGNNVLIGGTLSGCAVAGVTLYGTIVASPVSSGYAAWTAAVPLTIFESTDAAACPPGEFAVPLQALLVDDAGVNQWQSLGTSCTTLQGDVACESVGLSLQSAYPAPASSSSGPSVVIGGTFDAGGCPIAAVTVTDTYSATPLTPGYGAWTATVPLTVFEGFTACDGGGVSVPVEVLTPGVTGLATWSDAGAACVSFGAADTACLAPPTISVTGVFAAPAASASSPASVLIAGTADAGQCPISAMTLLNAYPVSPVGTSYASWTVTVPVVSVEEQPTCTTGAGGTGYAMTAQLLVPGSAGLSVWESTDAGCAPLDATTAIAPCQGASVSVSSTAYAVPAGSSTATPTINVAIGGTVTSNGCPVSGLVVMGAYTATPVTSNYAAWTASVPLTTVERNPCGEDGGPGSVSIAVPVDLLVPAYNGLPISVSMDAGCTMLYLEASVGVVDAGAVADASVDSTDQ